MGVACFRESPHGDQLVFVVVVVDSDSDGGEFPLMFRSDAAIIMLV